MSARPEKPHQQSRVIALVALAISMLALALSGYSVYTQQRAEQQLREVGRELQRALSPRVLPLQGPPPGLDLDDT